MLIRIKNLHLLMGSIFLIKKYLYQLKNLIQLKQFQVEITQLLKFKLISKFEDQIDKIKSSSYD